MRIIAGVTPEQLHADGWSIGYDERFPQSRRIQQCLLFARLDQDENFYAHPLDLCVIRGAHGSYLLIVSYSFPVLDSNTFQVIHIDFAATRTTSKQTQLNTVPPPLSADQAAAAARERIAPPLERFDFLSDLRPGNPQRTDLKPLHIVQPDGVSFSIDGHVLSWQKWKMHVGEYTCRATALIPL